MEVKRKLYSKTLSRENKHLHRRRIWLWNAQYRPQGLINISMETINEPTHPTDYRLVKLMDGSLLIGTISVDDNHMRIANPLEMVTTPRMTEHGLKEDTTLCRWIPFTQDKEFYILKDKVLVISVATVELAHYYEVVLEKIDKTDAKLALRPGLTPEDIDRILDIAEEMDSEFVGEDDDYNFDTFETPKTVH